MFDDVFGEDSARFGEEFERGFGEEIPDGIGGDLGE
jgi:hypothetical protein